jgi:hypothetical protein
MRAVHGIDVGDVVVRRDVRAAQEAAALGAAAFARRDEVVIPSAEGPLGAGRARGLLAHELTHVVQQRRLGRNLPAESSPAGRSLEQEAQASERYFRGDAGAPAPSPGSSPAPATSPSRSIQPDDLAALQAAAEELVDSGFATRDPSGALVFGTAAPGGPGDPDLDDAAAAAMALGGWEAAGGVGPTSDPGEMPFIPLLSRASQGWAPPVQRADEPASMVPGGSSTGPVLTETGGGGAAIPGTSAAPAEQPAGGAGSGEPPEPPELDLDDLARRLYERIRRRLRAELLIDRERAGLIADLR